jgi:hypothetical protein
MRFEQALWAMPAVYALHVAEEYGAAFPAWMTQHLQAAMDVPQFLLNNALFMAILVSLALWASRSRGRLAAFLFMGWASGHLFWNFVFHLATTVIADSYSPGLVTAVLLYFPVSLGVAALAVRGGRLGPGAVLAAFGLGAGLMLFVIWAGLWQFGLPFA